MVAGRGGPATGNDAALAGREVVAVGHGPAADSRPVGVGDFAGVDGEPGDVDRGGRCFVGVARSVGAHLERTGRNPDQIRVGREQPRRGAHAEERRDVRRQRRLADAARAAQRDLRHPGSGEIFGAFEQRHAVFALVAPRQHAASAQCAEHGRHAECQVGRAGRGRHDEGLGARQRGLVERGEREPVGARGGQGALEEAVGAAGPMLVVGAVGQVERMDPHGGRLAGEGVGGPALHLGPVRVRGGEEALPAEAETGDQFVADKDVIRSLGRMVGDADFNPVGMYAVQSIVGIYPIAVDRVFEIGTSDESIGRVELVGACFRDVIPQVDERVGLRHVDVPVSVWSVEQPPVGVDAQGVAGPDTLQQGVVGLDFRFGSWTRAAVIRVGDVWAGATVVETPVERRIAVEVHAVRARNVVSQGSIAVVVPAVFTPVRVHGIAQVAAIGIQAGDDVDFHAVDPGCERGVVGVAGEQTPDDIERDLGPDVFAGMDAGIDHDARFGFLHGDVVGNLERPDGPAQGRGSDLDLLGERRKVRREIRQQGGDGLFVVVAVGDIDGALAGDRRRGAEFGMQMLESAYGAERLDLNCKQLADLLNLPGGCRRGPVRARLRSQGLHRKARRRAAI